MRKARKILITGNTGLLGQAVVARVCEEPALEPVLFRAAAKRRNITSESDCEEAARGTWGIINLAALLPYKQCAREEIFAVNTEGAAILHEAGLAAGARFFVQASTQAVYDLARIPESGATEDSPIGPDSDYGASKLAAERYLLSSRGEIRTVIFRFCAMFGDRPSPQTLIEDMFQAVLDKKPICVRGLGERYYDVRSVWSIADIVVRSLSHALEGVYNLGSGRMVRVRDIAESFQRTAEVEVRYLRDKEEKKGYLLNMNKLRKRMRISDASLDGDIRRMLSVLKAQKP